MNGGFERARAVFGGETELEQVLASLNQAVFGLDFPGTAPEEDASHTDKPLN
jgi:type I restriction enzyme R subunit